MSKELTAKAGAVAMTLYARHLSDLYLEGDAREMVLNLLATAWLMGGKAVIDQLTELEND